MGVAAFAALVEHVDHGVEDARIESRDSEEVTEVAHRLQGIKGHSG